MIGAALAARAWCGRGGERPALRAALVLHWQRCGLVHVTTPLLTGAGAFRGDAPRQTDAWVAQFLAALAEEAEAGVALLRVLEREWFAARSAVRDRRRDSHASAAVDIMAAAPVLSATSLARSLGIAVKNAAALLDAFAARGLAIEVTHRSKRRLFGLRHLAPLREEALPPRRIRGAGGAIRRKPVAHWPAGALPDMERDDNDAAPPLRRLLALSPVERQEFEFSDLDDWMREADRVIRKSQEILDRLSSAAGRAATRHDAA